MMECDTLFMVGSGFPYTEFLPKEGQARGVQIDIKADMLSIRYPMEVNLVGDAKETLLALEPLLEQRIIARHGAKNRRICRRFLEGSGRAAHMRRRSRSIRNASLGICRHGCLKA